MLFAALGIITACVYSGLFWIDKWSGAGLFSVLGHFAAASALYLIAAYLLLFSRMRASHWVVLVMAVVFRLIVLFAGVGPDKMLSQDIWRYLWEGRVVAASMNPYALEPENKELSSLAGVHDKIWGRVEHKEVPAIYPPLAQYLFAATPPDVFLLRLIFVVFDVLTMLVLINWLKEKGKHRGLVLLYAWLPLPILEIAGSGHLDAMLILFMVLGVREFERGNRALGLLHLLFGVLSKPVALVPFGVASLRYLKLDAKKALLTIFGLLLLGVAAYLPFLLDKTWLFEGSQQYAERWTFNSSIYALKIHILDSLGYKKMEWAVKAGFALFLGLGLISLSFTRLTLTQVTTTTFVAVLMFLNNCLSLVFAVVCRFHSNA